MSTHTVVHDLQRLAADVDAALAAPVLVTGSFGAAARDLDLLARAPELAAIRQLLEDRGFHRWQHTWAGFGLDSVSTVDVVPAEGWGPGAERAQDLLFADSRAIEGFRWLRAPAPHVRLLLVAQSMLVGRGRLTAGKRARAVEAAADATAWQRAAAAAPELHLSGALKMLRRALEESDWTPGRQLAEVARAVAQSPGRTRLTVARAALPHRVRPVLVSLSGPDGSGKSTQAARLETALRQAGVKAATAWVPTTRRPPLPGRVRAAAERQARSGRASDSGAGSERGSRKGAKALGLRAAQHLWITSAALSNAAVMWKPLWQHRGKQVVVLDRFVLDAEVKLLYWYAVRRDIDVRVQRRLFRAVSPPTDVAVLLAVDPTTNHARRADEHDLEAFRRFQDLYRQVAGGYRAHVVDAEQSPSEVTRDLAAVVWRSLP